MATRAKIEKNIVRPSQVKQVVGFQRNFTGVMNTILSFAHHWHVPLCRQSLNRKILSGLHRSNYCMDFNQTLLVWSVPSLIVHIACTFRFVAQNVWLRTHRLSNLQSDGEISCLFRPFILKATLKLHIRFLWKTNCVITVDKLYLGKQSKVNLLF